MEQFLVTSLNEYGFITIFASFLIGIIASLNPCSILTLPFLITSSITLSNGLNLKNKKTFIYKYSFIFFLGLIFSYSILLLLFSKLTISSMNIASWFVYLLAGITTFIIVLYSLKVFKTFNSSVIINKLLPYKFLGAFIIGVLYGFISSTCASAPFIAMLTLASQSSWLGSYSLVFSFAIGQGVILLLAGLFVGVFQSISNNRIINSINKFINTLFIFVLIAITMYFFYKSYIYF